MAKLSFLTTDHIVELVKLVFRVHTETKHFADINISNYGHDVNVYATYGGFDPDKKYDLSVSFNIRDTDFPLKEAEEYYKAHEYLTRLLEETYV